MISTKQVKMPKYHQQKKLSTLGDYLKTVPQHGLLNAGLRHGSGFGLKHRGR